MSHERRYEALVSASSSEEAVEIAAEGLSPGQYVVRSEVQDVSATEGPGSYHVTLWFEGPSRRGSGAED